MPQQETKPENVVHTGKQVVLRLAGYFGVIVGIIILWKIVVG